jgi:hypothetical protein
VVYTTDAEIERYGLRLLEDDRGYFDDYQAVLLYRADLAERAPRAVSLLRRFEGLIRGCLETKALIFMASYPWWSARNGSIARSLEVLQ